MKPAGSYQHGHQSLPLLHPVRCQAFRENIPSGYPVAPENQAWLQLGSSGLNSSICCTLSMVQAAISVPVWAAACPIFKHQELQPNPDRTKDPGLFMM